MKASTTLRAGLTLLELVVVLAILAVLALVAVLATESTVEQTRFDVTQRQLQLIGDAALGTPSQPDSATFVGDVGRLPKAQGTEPRLQLSELWGDLVYFGGSPPPGLRAYSAATVTDTDIHIVSGWRGPYLRLSPGQTALTDGWGQPFALFQLDGTTPAGAGDAIGQVLTSGGPTAPYNIPMGLPLALGTAWIGEVKGMVTVTSPSSPPATATIKLYRPNAENPSGATIVARDLAAMESEPLRFSAAGMNTYTASYRFTNIPAAPVALRVYSNFATPTTDPRSTVVYVRVPPRGTVIRDLYLTIP